MSSEQEVNTSKIDKIRKQFPLEVYVNAAGNITINQDFDDGESILQLHYSQAAMLAEWICECALEAKEIQ